jgi:hypothetical protein
MACLISVSASKREFASDANVDAAER